MQDVRGRTYDGGSVETDDANFTDCVFNTVELRYAGGEHPLFEGCTFNGATSWRFTEAALRTIQFLQRIANDEGGEAFIADLFQPGKYFVE
ncbi:MAG: hypothetical protein JWO81_946 [Alphaproteobacteria bacterium]|nr:hypothetical protein [Alphaproteobacteria bacterium]